METHHQTGGESWGVRRGGRHGKGDCQLRRNTDQISNGCYTDVGSKSEVRFRISSGSSENRAVSAVAQPRSSTMAPLTGTEKAQPTHGSPSARTNWVDVWTAMRGHVVWLGWHGRGCLFVSVCVRGLAPAQRLFRGELRTRARDAESPTWLDPDSQRHLLSRVKATAGAASRPRRHARATRARCSEYPSAI